MRLLVENKFFSLFIEDQNVIMRTKVSGYPLKSFDQISKDFPRIKLHSFGDLKKALEAPGEDHLIGTYAPQVELYITPDQMKAEIYIHATDEEYTSSKEELIMQAEQLLDQKGIMYGRISIESMPFTPGRPFIAALGTPPITGDDAVVSYIELPERKPVIREDGSADYYELNFVTQVEKGDWLGEKIPAKEGITGSTVFGEPIAAKRGNDVKLIYDRKSIEEHEEEGKIVLRASFSGALECINGVIGIGRQLVISEDVGPKTGSITFDGTVQVLGTVLAGFSVNATGDISIEGNEGITNAKEIRSENGDIFIKGGVFGGGETVIEAKNSIFVKHANDCKLNGKTVHIGLYALGSEIFADHIKVDRQKGKVIGGRLEALLSIECAVAGNHHERVTLLTVKGIDKERHLEEIQAIAEQLKDRHGKLQTIEAALLKFGMQEGLSYEQLEALEKMKESKTAIEKEIMALDQLVKTKLALVQTATKPTIEVTKDAYPGVIIQIGRISNTLFTKTKGVFELTSDGLLNV